jgi:NAD(P)H-hydrate epimerase
MLPQSNAKLILTPHPGEMRRLARAFGLNENLPRHEQALALAEKSGAVILLKGHRSICASPEGRWSCNLSGSAALATAGSGDVLSGVCAAFLGQMPPMQAAALGAFLHGLCAERLKPIGSRGLIADDLLNEIPAAMAQINPKA